MFAGSAGPGRASSGPAIEASAVVRAPPDVVWELVTDIHLPETFTPELLGAVWIDGDEQPRVGARFVMSSQCLSIGSQETTATITQCELYRVFEWAVGDPAQPSCTWRYSLEPAGDETRLTLSVLVGLDGRGPAERGESFAVGESDVAQHRLDEHRTIVSACLRGVSELARR